MLPRWDEPESNSSETEGDDLKARVIRRAETIRRLWNGEAQTKPVTSTKQFQAVMLMNNDKSNCPYDFTDLKTVEAELATYSDVQKTVVSQYIPAQLLYCSTCNRAYINNSNGSYFSQFVPIKYLNFVQYTPSDGL